MARLEVKSDIAGKVWKIECETGAALGAEDTILILESMKMEIPVDAPEAGKLVELLVGEGDPVEEDQVVAILET